MEKIICSYCDSTNPANQTHCSQCHAQLPDPLEQQQAAAAMSYTPTQEPEYQASTNQHRRNQVAKESRLVLLVLLILFGPLGIHHFYAKRFTIGIIYLLTMGLALIGVVVDLILILGGHYRNANGQKIERWS